MTITAINLDQPTFDDLGIGLAELPLEPPLAMRSLGPLVVLAGPNGAGKSRLLRLLPKLLSKKAPADALEESERRIRSNMRHIDSTVPSIERLEALTDRDIPTEDKLRSERAAVAHWRTDIADRQKQLRANTCLTLRGPDIPKLLSFVPVQPKLVDPFKATEADAAERAAQLQHHATKAEANAPAYARRVIRLAMESGYKRLLSGGGPLTVEELAHDELVGILTSLLGADLELEVRDARLKIAGSDAYPDMLSPGQQILFQFGCLLHAQKATLSNCIVVMDEPENHLHPAVLAQVVQKLRERLPEGQLWIATHSVPLIAQLMAVDPDCLWYASEGRFKRAGRTPELVLESLMGGPAGARHLHDLSLLPSQFAALRFLTECLAAPGVVGADIKDPQTLQISTHLRTAAKARKAEHRRLRVLDFGAGKARLLATLRDGGETPVTEWLDYFAYDIDDEHAAACQTEIDMAYPGDASTRRFVDLHQLEAQLGSGQLDVVVMCNVLHEIDPAQWLELFGPSGSLARLLGEQGLLLLVEDYGIPVGERAHAYGFLLLDEPELCKLFDIAPADRAAQNFQRQASGDPRYKDRLTAHLIARHCMTRISLQTQAAAIGKLRDRMSDAVKNMLSAQTGAKGDAGRAYARSAQLLANASLWLRAMGQA